MQNKRGRQVQLLGWEDEWWVMSILFWDGLSLSQIHNFVEDPETRAPRHRTLHRVPFFLSFVCLAPARFGSTNLEDRWLGWLSLVWFGCVWFGLLWVGFIGWLVRVMPLITRGCDFTSALD